MKFKWLLLVFVLVLLVAPASAWLTGYNYRQGHYINGSDSGLQTNYQIMLNVSNTSGISSGDLLYTQGHNLNFPNDLRFTDTSDTQWDYWIESNNTTYATVWVEVPSIPSGSTSQVEMYVYYGKNGDTSASNGTNTFPELFDHFEGTSINTSKWVMSNNVTVSSSVVTVIADPDLSDLFSISTTFSENHTVKTRARTKHFDSSTREVFHWFGGGDSILGKESVYFSFDTASLDNVVLSHNGSIYTDTKFTQWSADTYHLCEIIRNGTSSVLFSFDQGSEIITHTTTLSTGSGRIYIPSENSDGEISLDWIFVRSYVYPEPTHSTYTAEECYPPSASFVGAPLVGASPLTVQFNDTSTTVCAISSWNWSFDDGTANDTTPNPSHIFTTNDEFDISLTIVDTYGHSSSVTYPAYISTLMPVANFTGTPTFGYTPLSVNFTDLSTSPTPILAWNWSFGDGTANGTTQNVSHLYTHSGLYNVTLTVLNAVGNGTLTRTNYINVSVMPNVIFSGIPLSGNTPLTVSFTDASTTAEGTIDTWDWMFGDGSPNSTTQNPTHTYTTSGLYSVSLTVTNSFGISNSTTYANYVNAGNASTPTPTPTPTQTPSNATGGTRGYSAEETAIPFWLWAVIIILGSSLLIAGLFGRHLIFGIMSTMCFADHCVNFVSV